MAMDLELEELDIVEAPFSDSFWEGVAIGLAIGAIVFT